MLWAISREQGLFKTLQGLFKTLRRALKRALRSVASFYRYFTSKKSSSESEDEVAFDLRVPCPVEQLQVPAHLQHLFTLEEDMDRYRECFVHIDTHGTGRIDSGELASALDEHGLPEAIAREIIQHVYKASGKQQEALNLDDFSAGLATLSLVNSSVLEMASKMIHDSLVSPACAPTPPPEGGNTAFGNHE